LEDEAIYDLYWARSEEAIARTHEKYGPWCRGIAIRILEIQEEAEECVSDTYLQVWNNIPPQRPGVFRAWLGRITRNLALDRYRKNHTARRGGGQTALALEELQDCVSGEATIETQLERQEIIDAINRFLETLPENQRNIFLRRYWHMTAVRDIANAYGISESRVNSMLFRLRKKLKAALEQEGIAV
jgi:RNA polymerase sigma-70 factor (ECF subfamily)